MLNRWSVTLTVVLLCLALWPATVGAIGTRACKQCSWDAYGQAICILGGGPGEEGGVQCYTTLWCHEGQCYEICYTAQACQWA